MKNRIGILGAVCAALFLCVNVQADGVLVSTFSATPIVPATQFTKITLALQNQTTNQIYLLGYPDSPNNCPGFLTNGVKLVGSSTATFVLPDYHGDLYACAPGATAPILLNFLGGQ